MQHVLQQAICLFVPLCVILRCCLSLYALLTEINALIDWLINWLTVQQTNNKSNQWSLDLTDASAYCFISHASVTMIVSAAKDLACRAAKLIQINVIKPPARDSAGALRPSASPSPNKIREWIWSVSRRWTTNQNQINGFAEHFGLIFSGRETAFLTCAANQHPKVHFGHLEVVDIFVVLRQRRRSMTPDLRHRRLEKR